MSQTYIIKEINSTHPKYKINYSNELNSEQLEAVMHLDGPLLCIAGAGSGKTRTLVYRVARLIESGVPPSNILLLTFTRKAAAQMISRVAKLIGGAGEKVAGGTFHSFANTILRQYSSLIGLSPNFTILDEVDSADVINLIRTELGLNCKETRFPQKKTLKEILSRAINTGRTVLEILNSEYSHFSHLYSEINELFNKYNKYKLENFLVDYDDLLILTIKLLESNSIVRTELSKKFRYILIDEFQDTNILQAKLTVLLASGHQNIMVVGDDAQSIYSFRGANFRNIVDFPLLFPNTKIVTLSENYRSTELILKAANNLMAHAKDGFKKELFSRQGTGSKPVLVPCEDESQQSAFVAQRILELREEGISLDKIAVLFRAGFHAFHLELELKRRNIPYVKYGGFKFLEAAHIKDMVAYLRVLQNPYDFISWQRILLLVEGVGTKSIPKLFERIKTAQNPYDLETISLTEKMTPGLLSLGNTLKKASIHKNSSIQTTVEILSDYYIPILKELFDDFPKRIADLDQFMIICSKYTKLQELLLDFALEPPSNSVDENLVTETDKEERLVLSTIHSAKGLEWHSVFIIWLLEGRFPTFAAIQSSADFEEERRLMYVAMTRARKNLFLCYPCKFWDPISGEFLAKPSPFINEIGDNNLEKWYLEKG